MQRMLATACAVMLASLVPAIDLEDASPVDATETAARHDRSASPEKNTDEKIPALRLASLSDGDLPLTQGGAAALLDETPRALDETPRANAAVAPDAANESTLSAVAPIEPRLPSLDALDAAFDVPAFPALAALDAAFDNRPIELPPVPLPSRRPPTYAEMCEALASAASAHSLPAPFLIRLIWQESRFRHNVISHAGAQGIAQFMPATANYMGLDDPFDPIEALPVSARFLRKLIERFGNLGLAAAAYNAGPKRVLDWLAGKGQLPKETQDYVMTITGQPAEKWRKPEATASLQRVPQRAPCQREAGLYAANGPDRIPLPPDRTPEKTVVAAADKKADGKKDKSVAKADDKATIKTAGKTDGKMESKTDTKAAASETRLASATTKPDAKSEAKTPTKSEAKAESKAEGKTESKSDAKPDTKAGKKPERKSVQLAAMSRAKGKADGRRPGKQHDRKTTERTKAEDNTPAASKPINLKPAAARAQAQADAKSDSKSARRAPKPAKKVAVAASR